MNSRMLKAIVKKDLKDIFRSKSLLTTLIIIPIIFSVILPTILVGSAVMFDIEKKWLEMKQENSLRLLWHK